ncbi:MAG TPA: hypothetical protein VMV10_06155 [Pirellulales bacterium]|nr:hypothetical protein [Pirellulales bacterium]
MGCVQKGEGEPQSNERMLGSNDEFATQLYNGYEEYVAGLYSRKS